MKKLINKSIAVFGTLIISSALFFIGGNKVYALSFNSGRESLWGGGTILPLTNSTYLRWQCEKVSGATNSIYISNNNGCSITAMNVENNSLVKIKITQIRNDGTASSVFKELELRANAVKVNIKVGETYNAGPDFKKLGLVVYKRSCPNTFTFSDSSILDKGGCGTYKFEAIGKEKGTSTLELESQSGIKFRAIITVDGEKELTEIEQLEAEKKYMREQEKEAQKRADEKIANDKIANDKKTNENMTTSKYIATKPISKPQETVVEVLIPKVTPVDDFNGGYRYVRNYVEDTQANPRGKSPTYSGYPLSCGDRVYVPECSGKIGDVDGLCSVSEVNGVSINSTSVYRIALRESEPTAEECGVIKRYAVNASYYLDKELTTKESKLLCGTEVIFQTIPSQACIYGKKYNGTAQGDIGSQYCEVFYPGRPENPMYIDRENLRITAPTKEMCEEGCTPVKPLTEQTTNIDIPIKVCYNYLNRTSKEKAIAEDEFSVFKCAKGYRRIMSEDPESNTCKTLRDTGSEQSCSKVFNYKCSSTSRPFIEGSGSLVRPDGKGSINFHGMDSVTKTGLRGYIIFDQISPTINSDWQQFSDENYTELIQGTPGTYFVSVMTNDNAISYPLTLSVHSDEITTTADIALKSPDGNISYTVNHIQGQSQIGYNSRIQSTEYVRLSNKLNNDSVMASGFDLFVTGYEVTVTSNKIAVFATLKSDDARYVEGYGARTVDLKYGKNVVLVKIENSSGNERTYTFIVNRKDTRLNENTLSDLTTSVGSIKFDSHISDYTVSVPKNTKTVNINGTLDGTTSSFVKGYEPRTVNLNSNITSAIIKTISEAGIIRNYIVTYVKSGTKIEETFENSTYLSSLTIPGTDIKFDKTNMSYSVAVPYEVENVPVYTFAENSDATVEINGNLSLQIGANKLEIVVTNGSVSKIYNVFINRKEDSLGISNNTKLSTLTVKDYDINFNPNVTDYIVKIKREKSLLLTSIPESDRSEVYMYGNNDLNAFSTVRIKVIAENGDTGLYSVDIIKDLYNKQLETTAAITGGIILSGAVILLVVRKKRKNFKDYVGE